MPTVRWNSNMLNLILLESREAVCVCVSDQVNPAVTLSLLATRKLDALRAIVYMVAQCLGACVGASALYLALPLKATAEHFVNRVSLQNATQFLLNISHTFLLNASSVSIPLKSHSGSCRFECSAGSVHRGSVHLSDGFHHLLSGGAETEGECGTRKSGHWTFSHCWSANRGKKQKKLDSWYICLHKKFEF